jgi:hypothetical protein
MARRDRITLGLALAVTGVAVMGREFPWIAIPLEIFALFLIVWGREERRTEAFIGRLPGGKYLLRALLQLDLILSPRDLAYEGQIQAIITGYEHELRESLRRLWRTRNPSDVPQQHWERFKRDGLVEHSFSGPGGVRAELREIVGRALDELGV